ncbi:MAG: SdpI family protein [Lachnospirales bacterium]
MNFSILVLISVIPIPTSMIAFGTLWRKHPPKSINWIYGYRTIRAMKNDNTWRFAHLYQAKLWRWSGSILLLFALIFSLTFTNSYKEIPSWVFYVELGVMILTIIPTEIALRKKFDKEGNLN